MLLDEINKLRHPAMLAFSVGSSNCRKKTEVKRHFQNFWIYEKIALRRQISRHRFLRCNHIAIANIVSQWEFGILI